jgi:hypothetical protein
MMSRQDRYSYHCRSLSAHPNPYWLTVREDMVAVLQTLVRNCPGSEGSDYSKFAKPVIENGDNVRNEFWTGQKWERAQVGGRSRRDLLYNKSHARSSQLVIIPH